MEENFIYDGLESDEDCLSRYYRSSIDYYLIA